MKVTIREEDCTGWDELYDEWFTCPKCKEDSVILLTHSYCPNCGAEIIIDESVTLKREKMREGYLSVNC